MHSSSTVSYDLAQARIADLRHQARQDGLARAVAHSSRPARRRFRSVLRHRAAATAS